MGPPGRQDPPDQLDEHVAKLLESNYSIHFHVWDHAHFGNFLKRTNDHLGNPFAVEFYGQNGLEVITILRKLRSASTTGTTISWISNIDECPKTLVQKGVMTLLYLS